MLYIFMYVLYMHVHPHVCNEIAEKRHRDMPYTHMYVMELLQKGTRSRHAQGPDMHRVQHP